VALLRPLDLRQQRRHKIRNVVHSALLLVGMIALLCLCAWLIAGPGGVLWALIGGGFALLLAPGASPRLILRMYRAQEIPRYALPEVHKLLSLITEKARLPETPRLYYVPSSMLNAFAVGRPRDAAIAITDGMLRTLSLREIAGVLAHEISHIRNNDLVVMSLADVIAQLTRIMAIGGMLLLLITLPAWLAEASGFPWLLILVLMLAPTFGSLLQLALSRAREYDADLDAAGLTGDPAGLATALEKMERLQGGFVERIMLPGQRIPDPSLLRTHPPIEKRIRRLLSLAASEQAIPIIGQVDVPLDYTAVRLRPRRRMTGMWY
jgi:heat shock protein HtpX